MKIHLKNIKKDREEMLLLKIKKSKPSLKMYKVDYKIQDTDGFHKIHVPHRDPALSSMGTSLTENTGHHVACSL